MPEGSVLVELSVSLDGFVAGPNVDVDRPLGDGGDRLHDWMFSGRTPEEAEAFEVESFANVGALVMGRRVFDVGVGPWGDNPTFHAPCFVVSHRSAARLKREGGTSYTFVTDGIESALEQARAAAAGKTVMVMGGANIVDQYVGRGFVDEIVIHLVPVVLGAGTQLFDRVDNAPIEFERTQVIQGPDATHLRFRLIR
jgi:dihydrofolate reductase